MNPITWQIHTQCEALVFIMYECIEWDCKKHVQDVRTVKLTIKESWCTSGRKPLQYRANNAGKILPLANSPVAPTTAIQSEGALLTSVGVLRELVCSKGGDSMGVTVSG